MALGGVLDVVGDHARERLPRRARRARVFAREDAGGASLMPANDDHVRHPRRTTSIMPLR